MPNTKEAAVTEPAEKPAKKRGANKAAADAPKKRASSKAASRTKETAPEVKSAEAPKRQRARKAPAPKAEDITKPETAPQLPRESAQEAPAEDISAPEVPVLEMPIETAPETAETVPEPIQEEAKSMPEPYFAPQPGPRRSVVFIGSECYPFVKTGGLADVMYALPKALSRMNCDVKVILPR